MARSIRRGRRPGPQGSARPTAPRRCAICRCRCVSSSDGAFSGRLEERVGFPPAFFLRRRSYPMHRRDFLTTSAAALAFSSFPFAEQFADTHKRVGLIGAGWYGKTDLLRLVQVAPVDVVSLCDVDKTMLAEAAELVASRQVSKKTPRTYTDYRQMLKERDLDIVIIVTPDHWHALAMIDA